jgi:hypothetical protein
MTQNQINRLRECKRMAMELESELRDIYSEMLHDATWHDDSDALQKNTLQVHHIYEISSILQQKLNATIL